MNSLLNTFSWISQIRFSNTAHINVLQLLPFSRIRDFQGIPVDFLYFGPEIYSSFQVLKQNSCIYNIYSTEDSRAHIKQLQGSTGLTWWFCSIQTHGNWKKKSKPTKLPFSPNEPSSMRQIPGPIHSLSVLSCISPWRGQADLPQASPSALLLRPSWSL